MKQERKKSPKEGRTQVRMTFVIDRENADWLSSQLNKSRTVNEALEHWRNEASE